MPSEVASQAVPDHSPPRPAEDPLDADLACPMCDYNLRGLAEPRCPECGYSFFWVDLLDPRRRIHPYLFEHHPEKNFRSFVRTLLGGLRPARFWSSLLPSQPSSPGRLFSYAVIAVLLSFTGHVAELMRSTIEVHAGLRYGAPATLGTWLMALARAVERDRILGPLTVVALVPPAWAWLTYCSLLIFGTSMEQAKVNTSHVKRCVIYSLDVCAWYGLASVVAVLFAETFFRMNSREDAVTLAVMAMLTAITIFTYRMCQAYRKYIRFHRPIATVVAAQVIVALVALNVLTICVVAMGRR